MEALAGDALGSMGKEVSDLNPVALHVGEVVGRRLLQIELALLHEPQDQGSTEGLGQGGDVVRGFGRREYALLPIGEPEPFVPDNLLVADDGSRQTGDFQEHAELVQLPLEPQEPILVGREERLSVLLGRHAGAQEGVLIVWDAEARDASTSSGPPISGIPFRLRGHQMARAAAATAR